MPASTPSHTVWNAFVSGWQRLWHAPALTLGVTAAIVALAVSLGIGRTGGDWHPTLRDELSAQAQGLGTTFVLETLGVGATVALTDDFLRQVPLPRPVMVAAVASILLWLFVSGGVLDRLARARPIRTAAFFGACGVYFVRFIRLTLIMGVIYWMLFTWLHPLGSTILFAVALTLVNVIHDYAKVRAVVEDRHSMLSALGAAFRFVRRRPLRVLLLSALNAVATLVVLALWYAAAPAGLPPSTWMVALTPLYLLFRVVTRLAWMSAEVAFFQGELAHAHYAAAPLPVWPDSPAAEALENLVSRQ